MGNMGLLVGFSLKQKECTPPLCCTRGAAQPTTAAPEINYIFVSNTCACDPPTDRTHLYLSGLSCWSMYSSSSTDSLRNRTTDEAEHK